MKRCKCGHPFEDHDAGECWWDMCSNIQSDMPINQCPCAWLEEAP